MTSPDDRQPTIGHRIRTIRRSRRLTQRAVAAQAGLAEPFLSRVENDHAEPSLATLERLAAAMGVTIGDLVSASPATFKPSCPVSHSGRCIAELIYQPGPGMRVEGERYSSKQIRLLRLANYLVQYGTPETLDALETVMRGMLKLPGKGRDARWLRALTRPTR